MSYKGAVESQGRESGAAGNNQRSGQQGPRNKNYKGKGFAYDNIVNMRITTNLVIRDQNGDFSRNLRQPIHLLPKKIHQRGMLWIQEA